MSSKKPARGIAISFFIVCLAILYAGADHPPPPGFILLVLLALFAAWLVARRVPVYRNWGAEKRRWRRLRTAADSAMIGLAFALLTRLINPVGEPSVQPSSSDTLTWFAVLTCVGATASLAVYALSALIDHIGKAR